jgi:hypothetical protein
MTKHTNLIIQLEQMLRLSDHLCNFQINKSEGENSDMIKMAEDFLEISLSNSWYEEFSSLSFSWQSTLTGDFNLCGSCRLLSLAEICTSWLDYLYFEEDSYLNEFFPIDIFTNESLVGLYKGSTKLYLFDLEEEPDPLYIDLKDYTTFLAETGGFLYWQKMILSLKGKKETTESVRYAKNIPLLFNDHSRDTLKELYFSKRTKGGK